MEVKIEIDLEKLGNMINEQYNEVLAHSGHMDSCGHFVTGQLAGLVMAAGIFAEVQPPRGSRHYYTLVPKADAPIKVYGNALKM